MKNSLISWCHHTLNSWVGCAKVSAECKNCYAAAIDKRAGNDFSMRRRTKRFRADAIRFNKEAESAGKMAIVFSNSMSDVFDPTVPREWRDDVWDVVRSTPNLYWMLVTKRPHLILERNMLPDDWGNGYHNVWLGTTCGSLKRYRCRHTKRMMTGEDRVKALQAIPCTVRFISAEPLLEDVSNIDLKGIHWVAVGGESGPEWDHEGRFMSLNDAMKLHDRCKRAGIRFLFKQVSHVHSERGRNALSLHLARRDRKLIDPMTCELIAEYPAIADGKLMSFPAPGPKARFSRSEYHDYLKQPLVGGKLVQIATK